MLYFYNANFSFKHRRGWARGKKNTVSLQQLPAKESIGNSILDTRVLSLVLHACLRMYLQASSAVSERIMLKIGTMYFEKNENVRENFHRTLHHGSWISSNSSRPYTQIWLQCSHMLMVYSGVQISLTMSYILKNSTITSLSLTLFKNN